MSGLFSIDHRLLSDVALLQDMPIIVVSINYRLAAWGLLSVNRVHPPFLAHAGSSGGREASANSAVNLALYDQRVALEWVQDNIESFGGDKNKVTLGGQSTGSYVLIHT